MRLTLILLLISTALSAYYENVVLIHKNGKVKHTTNTVLAAGKTAYSNTDWNETAIQQKYNLPLVIRSGENSSCVLLLAQQTLVFLDRKSLIRISRTPQQKVYAFYCRLIRGRTALEKYQQKNTNSMFYLTAGRIKIKLLKGKNCISYNPRLNTLTAIQKNGKSMVLPPSPKKPGAEPAFSFFYLQRGQRIDFKNLRYNIQDDYFIKTSQWRFAFPWRKNKQNSMLDIKEKWQ